MSGDGGNQTAYQSPVNMNKYDSRTNNSINHDSINASREITDDDLQTTEQSDEEKKYSTSSSYNNKSNILSEASADNNNNTSNNNALASGNTDDKAPVMGQSAIGSAWKSNISTLGDANSFTFASLGLSPFKVRSSSFRELPKRENSSSSLNMSHSMNPDIGTCFGADFGGSLTKIVFFDPDDLPEDSHPIRNFLLSSERYGSTGVRDSHLSFRSENLRGRFHFLRYESSRTTAGAITLIQKIMQSGVLFRKVHATGGGAFKYGEIFQRALGITLEKKDELESVVRGIIFTLLEDPEKECFAYEPVNPADNFVYKDEMDTEIKKVPRPVSFHMGSFFPFLVVNIGSGVSIIKVESPTAFRRVSGTALGGATFFGLCKLLTRCETFDEAMNFAERGNSKTVNLRVEDIYGGSYDRIGLPGNLTACFFGKAAATYGASLPASSSHNVDVLRYSEPPSLFAWMIGAAPRTGIDNSFFGGALSRTLEKYPNLRIFLPSREFIRGALFGLLCTSIFYFNKIVYESGLISVSEKIIQDMVSTFLMPVAMPLAVVPVLILTVFFLTIVIFTAYLRYRKNIRKMREEAQANANAAQEHRKAHVFKDEDIARALVVMISQNVTQIAFLNAKLHNTKKVIFTGNFLRHNTIALKTLSNMMRIWSKGDQVDALFLEHEGFLGAIGCFLYSSGLADEQSSTAAATPQSVPASSPP